MSVVIFILIFGLSIFLLVLFLVLNFLRNLFRFGKRSQNQNQDFPGNNSRTKTSGKKKKKIFDNNEGEYIEYEEIRD
jgi:uncharacterized protein HemY